MKEVKVAMLGYGGIAHSHHVAYTCLAKEAAPVRLVAICDIDPARFVSATSTNLGAQKNTSLEGIHTYTNPEEMMEKEEFDMADICLPSYLHREYAIRMLKAGKHVLSEKPMALTSEDCLAILNTARECGRKLMIGQCLRFEPSYVYLKKCIDEKTFGELKGLYMDRLSAHPMWGFEKWYTHTEKSGGCIMDLHIHDIDMARFLLGEPEAVSTVSYDGITRWQVVNTRLYYKNLTVIADGSWGEPKSCKFRFSYRARFENAGVVFNGNTTTVYPDDGTPYQVELPAQNRIAGEIGLLASMILNPELENHDNPPESAYKTVQLIEKLRESADANGAIIRL